MPDLERLACSAGLPLHVLNQLVRVFQQFPAIKSVQLFGSRALGNYKEGSDIDLALDGDISFKLSNQIMIAIDELLLPYEVDLVVLRDVENQQLLDHVTRIGLMLYKD